MFALLLTALAVGADVEPATTGQPPLFVTASVKDDRLVRRIAITSYKAETRAVEVNVNGKIEKRTETVQVPFMQMIEQAWDLKKATVKTAGGKKLDLDALKKLLDKPRAVIVSSDGKAVPESYLKLLDKDAIVIVAPPAADKGR
jgi:hypothetical protein